MIRDTTVMLSRPLSATSLLRPSSARRQAPVGARRTVTVAKNAGPLGVALREDTFRNVSTVSLLSVKTSSPLYGLAWPGEILREIDADGEMHKSFDSESVVHIFNAASNLTMTIETPPEMEGAQSVRFFRQDVVTPIGISYAQEKGCSYPRLIEHLEAKDRSFRSIASQLSGSDRMFVGDLVVGVTHSGNARHVTSVKDLNTELAGASGEIEIRLVRSTGQENAGANSGP
uniref:Uncharacterized protein n=1 Tax=Haptolina brevifila TaxID=156173 RepID=A0A7S2FQA8_9EUKA|mmetsp:Transcript_17645/g.35499  ORF Transcript_17645/g.35499 Transcript_17645/m.35499 type:complete len:230 (+) Transcript_17645:18-707(+)